MTVVRLPTVVAAAVLCALAIVVAPTLPVASAQVSSDLPQRAMHDDVFRNDKGWLVFKGNVDPGWNNKSVQVFKRTCTTCTWALVKKVRTDGSGRWRTRIYAPRTGSWYWRGVVPPPRGGGEAVTPPPPAVVREPAARPRPAR